MNIIKYFELKSKEIKSFLYSFSIIIDIKIVNIITIVDIIKIVFCNKMLVVINDSLSLLTLT